MNAIISAIVDNRALLTLVAIILAAGIAGVPMGGALIIGVVLTLSIGAVFWRWGNSPIGFDH